MRWGPAVFKMDSFSESTAVQLPTYDTYALVQVTLAGMNPSTRTYICERRHLLSNTPVGIARFFNTESLQISAEPYIS
jgi:hypothetical protein